MSERKLGAACDVAQSSRNFGARSDTTPKNATSTARSRFVITFSPAPGADAIRSLRWLLKIAKRRLGLIALDAYEDRSSTLPTSNQVADDFHELRDEVVADRAGLGEHSRKRK